MKSLYTAWCVEWLKLKRLPIGWILVGLFVFIPLMFGLMLYISLHPESASRFGLFALKAQLFGHNDWQGYLTTVIQAGAGLGFIGSGFCFSYVFGREYTDRTFKDLLALPMSRLNIVTVKVLVASVWSFVLMGILLVSSLLVGRVMGVSGSFGDAALFSWNYLLMTVCTILVNIPIAFFAVKGKGILAPIGFCIVTLIASNLVATVGIGSYFPWAIPGLIGMNSGLPGMMIHTTSYLIVISTAALGYFLTLRHWMKADHT